MQDVFAAARVALRLHRAASAMRFIRPLLNLLYSTIALVFAAASVALLGLAVVELWHAVGPSSTASLGQRAAGAIESIGLITVSLMALEMAQTVIEEEVMRRSHVSAPTRVRRYISRFLVVVVVALSIESLVGVVEALHRDPTELPHAASVALGAAALLAAWGLFVRLNRSVEELEPEGINEARREDAKVNDEEPDEGSGDEPVQQRPDDPAAPASGR